MTALCAAVRTIAFATLFVWLWTAVGLWARQFDPMFGGLLPSWTWPLGVAALTAGVPLALTCMALFAIRGKGTLAPFDPPRTFVAFGPYRAVRNPMYVGAGLALTGAAIFYQSWWLLGYVGTYFVITHLFVTVYEEPTLRRTFGEEYEAYCRRVGRWRPKHI